MRAALLMWADHLKSIVDGDNCRIVPLRAAGTAAGYCRRRHFDNRYHPGKETE
jgi:hypothetical protein